MKIVEAREKIEELVNLQKQLYSKDYIIGYLIESYALFMAMVNDEYAIEHEKKFLDHVIDKLKLKEKEKVT